MGEVISDEYRSLQQQMHRNRDYGRASIEAAPFVADHIRRNNVRRMLDYGAGKGRLGAELEWLVPWPVEVLCYDPAIPAWSAAPQPCEFVTCIDVLEHIEPPLLENVLDDLKRVTAGAAIFTVATAAALKTLPDGRNAHLIQQPARWWLPLIMDRFELRQFISRPYGFTVELRTLAG